MSSSEILLTSLLSERTEKQITETVIPSASLFSFNSDKWSTSFSFICHTSNKATWPCLLALKHLKCVISLPKENTPN